MRKLMMPSAVLSNSWVICFKDFAVKIVYSLIRYMNSITMELEDRTNGSVAHIVCFCMRRSCRQI